MRPHIILTLVSLAMLGFAPAPFPRTPRHREDPADVAGTWAFELYEMGGTPYEQGARDRIEMTKEQFVFVNTNGTRTKYVMHMDPSASPPSFTWCLTGPVMFVGSYRLEKDRIEMIFRHDPDVTKRPTDFASKPPYHFVLRRVSR